MNLNVHHRSQSTPVTKTQSLQPHTQTTQTTQTEHAKEAPELKTSDPSKFKSPEQPKEVSGGDVELQRVQSTVQNTSSDQIQAQADLVDDLVDDLLEELMAMPDEIEAPQNTAPQGISSSPVFVGPTPAQALKTSQDALIGEINELRHGERDLMVADKSVYDLIFATTDPNASLQDQVDSLAFHQFCKNSFGSENVDFTMALHSLAKDPGLDGKKVAGIIHDFVDTKTASATHEINISSKDRKKILAAMQAYQAGTGDLAVVIDLLNKACLGGVKGNLNDMRSRFVAWRGGAVDNDKVATSTFRQPAWFGEVHKLSSERARLSRELSALGVTVRSDARAKQADLELKIKQIDAQLAPFKTQLPGYTKITNMLKRDIRLQDPILQSLRQQRDGLKLTDLSAKKAIDQKIKLREQDLITTTDNLLKTGKDIPMTYAQFTELQSDPNLPAELRGIPLTTALELKAGTASGRLEAPQSLEQRSLAEQDALGLSKAQNFFKQVKTTFTATSNTLQRGEGGAPKQLEEVLRIVNNPKASYDDKVEGFAFKAYVYHEYAGEHLEFYGELRQTLKLGEGSDMRGKLKMDTPEFKHKLSYVYQRFISERGTDSLNLSSELRNKLHQAYAQWQANPDSHAAMGELMTLLGEAQNVSRFFLNTLFVSYSSDREKAAGTLSRFKTQLQGETVLSPHGMNTIDARGKTGIARQKAQIAADNSRTVMRPVHSEPTMTEVFNFVGKSRFDPARREDNYNHDFLNVQA